MSFRSSAKKTAVLLILLMAAAGCDTSFDPFVEEAGYFSVSGYLNADADTQFVRLNILRNRVLIVDSLDAVVRTTALSNDRRITWRDSLVRLDDGRLGHLYYGLFTPQAGESYRLIASAPGIRAAEAVTTLPSTPELHEGPAVVQSSEADDDVAQSITWLGVQGDVIEAEVTYTAQDSVTGFTVAVPIDYFNTGRTTEEGRLYLIQIERDLVHVLNALDIRFSDPPPILHDISMRLKVLSSDWGTEIKGGVGTFGSVITASDHWLPPTIAIDSAGYAVPDSLE